MGFHAAVDSLGGVWYIGRGDCLKRILILTLALALLAGCGRGAAAPTPGQTRAGEPTPGPTKAPAPEPTEGPKAEDMVRAVDIISGIFIDARYATERNFTGQVIYDSGEVYYTKAEDTQTSLMDYVKPSPVAEMLHFSADPTLISFAGGMPDATIFPVEELRAAFDRALAEKGAQALQYSTPEGLPSLREKVCERMARAGVKCSLDNVLLTQGGTQGIDLVAALFLDRGDTILCENPTYMGAMGPFDVRDVNYVSIDIDDEGMNIELLEKALKEHPEAKMIYVIPDFQNPTGVSMSVERRRRIVELANQYDVLVLEDNPYRELRFDNQEMPSIKSFDTQGRVILLGTFSKTLCPGLRLGWAVAEKEIVSRLTTLRTAADMQCSSIAMYAVDAYLEAADFDGHIREIRRVYKEKKDCMIDAMQRHFPKGITHTNPEGGLFLWLTFPEKVDAGRMLRELVIPRAKTVYMPGEAFYCHAPHKNTCRMNFSGRSMEEIEKGIAALGEVFCQVF